MTSLRTNLTVWLLCALSAGTVLLGLSSFYFTLDEMDDVFDEQLRQVALAASTQHDAGTQLQRKPIAKAAENIVFVTQAWRADGSREFTSLPEAEIPYSATEGLATVTTKSGAWRVYTAPSNAGVVQVAENAEARASLAADAAVMLLIPCALMAIVTALLLKYALRRGLQPLAAAAGELERRSATSLDPVAEETLPDELRPLVVSINGLMLRLSGALSQQRKFVAEAAHELRTPLAALGAQMHLLKRAGSERERAEALEDMQRGVDRATHLVAQLLSLSRLEPDGVALQPVPVDLAEMARSVVGDFSARAETAGIDLGAEARSATPINGDQDEIRTLLNNLVDNALRYTPAGGRVDVSVRHDRRKRSATIEVRDNGPGIEVEERERVFDRFYRASSAQGPAGRIEGTGLGLAIVKAIALRHDTDVHLADGLSRADGGAGLTVSVSFAEHFSSGSAS